MEPEFMCDALDDLAELFEAPPPPSVLNQTLPAPMRALLAQAQRLQGVGDPAFVGGTGLDIGFLLAVHEMEPDLFADLVAWRLGSVAQDHATGRQQDVAEDQVAASRARRHREYRDGLREKRIEVQLRGRR